MPVDKHGSPGEEGRLRALSLGMRSHDDVFRSINILDFVVSSLQGSDEGGQTTAAIQLSR